MWSARRPDLILLAVAVAVGTRLALPTLCLLLLALSWLSNLTAPTEPQTADRLNDLDKARIAEALHLRASLGDQVWPGWGAASIPAIVYNEAYAFLVGLPDPADGWLTVPRRTQEGSPWERVPGDDFSPLFPHWLFTRQAIGGSDGYIAGLLHEAFHAYAGLTVPEHDDLLAETVE